MLRRNFTNPDLRAETVWIFGDSRFQRTEAHRSNSDNRLSRDKGLDRDFDLRIEFRFQFARVDLDNQRIADRGQTLGK